MATTGWKFPSGNTLVTNNSLAWANPTNAYADDSNETIAGPAASGPTNVHAWTNFGFTTSDIPLGATIDGIEVEIRYAAENEGSVWDIDLQLYDGTSLVGNQKTTGAALFIYSTEVLGGAADLWGTTSTTLDSTDIRSTGFGVALSATGWTSWDGPWVRYVKIRVTYTEGSSDTNVSAAAEALTLTEHAANVALNADISAALESLTLTTYPADLTRNIEVLGSAESLVVTGLDAFIGYDKELLPGLESLALTTNSATITRHVAVNAALESLAIAGLQATISLDKAITIASQSLVVTALAAGITSNSGVQAALQNLTITTNAALVQGAKGVSAAAEALALTTYPATVIGSNPVYALSESLIVTTLQAGLTFNRTLRVGETQLVITTLQAGVDDGVFTGVTIDRKSAVVVGGGETITIIFSTDEYLTL